MRISDRWRQLLEVYRFFAREHDHLFDWSEEMALEHIAHESNGSPTSENNGYSHGQTQATLHLDMWHKDHQEGLLMKYELLEDPQLAPVRCWIEESIADWPPTTHALLR